MSRPPLHALQGFVANGQDLDGVFRPAMAVAMIVPGVMVVVKTASPAAFASAPKAYPRNTRPAASASAAS